MQVSRPTAGWSHLREMMDDFDLVFSRRFEGVVAPYQHLWSTKPSVRYKLWQSTSRTGAF